MKLDFSRLTNRMALNSGALLYKMSPGFQDFVKTAPIQRDFTKSYLGPALTKAGFGKDKLQIMPFDDFRLGDLVSYVDTIWKDQDAAKYLSGLYNPNWAYYIISLKWL